MNLPLIIHIGGGIVALCAGAFAIAVRKGSRPHKRAGYVFVGGMLIMAVPGGVVSFLVDKPFDVMSTWLACYMVLSGWLAFRSVKKTVAISLMALGGGCFIGYLLVELYALFTNVRSTDAPPGAGYVFATILGLALFGDYRHRTTDRSTRQKTIRHLWRMCFGLFIASGSFFGARPHLFPDWMQTYGVLLLLSLAPVLVMAYWRFKLRARSARKL